MMELFEHSEKLTRIFRGWPSFHDAEVVRLILDRTGSEAPSLEAWIHVFQATSEVDSTGHYVLKNHTLVTFTLKRVKIKPIIINSKPAKFLPAAPICKETKQNNPIITIAYTFIRLSVIVIVWHDYFMI